MALMNVVFDQLIGSFNGDTGTQATFNQLLNRYRPFQAQQLRQQVLLPADWHPHVGRHPAALPALALCADVLDSMLSGAAASTITSRPPTLQISVSEKMDPFFWSTRL
ncbi:uncharacterized protein B0T23DRAFT_426131 [Neurospora hispaniola]|uniref:Uncharacterized protein n=1 Tax=Neurospora hispaniola TaxID=588809 RepID=A0AAJ0IC04_9PEZI|nr:hypothetical protein B0T23DRAFT_426131 [Neurospora hispaniola]